MAMVALTLVLAACGSGEPPRAEVRLLPAQTANGRTWNWTAQCPLGPVVSEGCGRAGPILRFAQLNGDEWNLGGTAGAGSVDMSVGASGAVTIEGSFSSTSPCTETYCLAPSADTWVRGYPSVLYGINQCYASTSPPESPQLPLPMRLDSIPANLIGVTAYSAHTAQVSYDVAYDLWLNPSGTKRPCRSAGTLEIMVWTDYDAQALLPASLQIGTANIPVAVDGAAMPATRPWAVYASNIYRAGRTEPWGGTLWFVPSQAGAVSHGKVSIDLSAVFAAARLLLRDDYGWPELGHHYWLDTASFGVEFGPASANPLDSGPSQFSAQISAYCLDADTTLLEAACA